MSNRSTLVSETVGGRLILILLAMMTAVMTIQAIIGASQALAMTERPGNTYMTNGKVYATALSADGKTLYIGGNFNEVSEKPSGTTGASVAVSNVAAINVKTGTPIRGWRPRVSGDGAVVRSLALKNGRVYIGGNFTAVDGKPRKNLAAVDANTAGGGSLLPFDPNVGGDTSYVYALEAGGSKLYAGGGFSKVNGEPRRNLAAFSLATGALDPDWKPATSVAKSCNFPRCSPKVRALELGPGGTSLFVGGPFSYITGSDGVGAARQSVARVYTDTGKLHPWRIPKGKISSPQTAWDLTAAHGTLYGGFGAKRNFLAAFHIDKGNSGSQIWRYQTHGNVQTVALTKDGSRLFFGGHFGLNGINQKAHRCGGKRLRGLASVKPATGRLYCDFIPSLDQRRRPNYEGAWTLATTNSYLWVGGGFIGVSNSKNPQPSGNGVTEVPQTNLARFTL
jgi:hypothetical protein